MSIIARWLRMSVFMKVFLGFLIVALPLYGTSLSTTWKAGSTISSETQSSTHSKLQFFLEYLKDELQNVNQMLVALNNDPDLPSLLLMQDSKLTYEVLQLSNQIQSKMNIVYYSSDYVTDVFLLLPRSGKQLSVNKGGLVKIEDSKRGFLNRHIGKFSLMDRFIDNNSITYTIAITQNSETEVSYLLGVEISQSKILESLKKFDADDKYHTFLVDNASKRYVGREYLTSTDKVIYETLKNSPELKKIEWNGVRYMVQSSKDQFFTVISYVEEGQVLGSVNRIRNSFWILAAVSFAFLFVYSLLIFQQIHKPLNRLVRTMKAVEKGDVNVYIPNLKEDEFGYVYRQFNRMVGQLRNLIEEVLENKIRMQQAQLKQLQSQINPHFLFNCFYIGYRMAKSGEMDNVAKLCKYLGDYFRFVTQRSEQDVLLEEEMKYTSTYLEIQLLRFSNKLSYRVEMEEGLGQTVVPGLIIQPLVENALLHGIEKVNRPGLITICIRHCGTFISVEVKDNGPGMEEEALRQLTATLNQSVNDTNHCGLWNVHWRLKHTFGESSGLRILNLEEGGLCVSFEVPASSMKFGETA
ncbi:sensor histidine kinase [Paenibacillus gansuensis]|uniref:Sensor histidine kinase n=1 Tax=Paenibacillus gansuensis TaxID=306542 RepID=A0ABW5PBN0_9BACL